MTKPPFTIAFIPACIRQQVSESTGVERNTIDKVIIELQGIYHEKLRDAELAETRHRLMNQLTDTEKEALGLKT